MSKDHFQFFVEHFGPCLEQEMCSTESPLHLLLPDKSSADHLIDRPLALTHTNSIQKSMTRTPTASALRFLIARWLPGG
jgi:hypothetical protein